MRVALAIGKLHHAEPVAVRVQPHGLAINRNIALKRQTFR
jgi:hypothetical protein